MQGVYWACCWAVGHLPRTLSPKHVFELPVISNGAAQPSGNRQNRSSIKARSNGMAWHGMAEVCEGAPVAVGGWVLTNRHDLAPCAA